MARIGIRHEDKSRWESRAPLTPAAVRRLIREEGVEFTIQSSPSRAFTDRQYAQAGATVAADLADCPIIMGVKEIPPEKFEESRAYVYFSHTIKGQPENMPMLRRLMDLRCHLIDYERITDAEGQRLVFFGRFAGLAGMIDTLWAFGRRLEHESIDSPFAAIRPAHEYKDLEHARREIRAVGKVISDDGLPPELRPFVCGFAGYGQVSQGAQEIFDLLPFEEIAPADLEDVRPAPNVCYKVVFCEDHMVERVDGSAPFELQEYYEHPDRYRAAFFAHAAHLSILLNCIYWDPRYPRMITREQFGELYGGGQPRLRVIGDITCDIDGSLACTTRATEPSSPVYVYEPATGVTRDGVAGRGPVVLAVDFLPCELPVDASEAFSEALLPFIGPLARADCSGPLADSGLPEELVRATIVYQGALTEPYQYLEEYLS
jgi:alanine dehydrogenase